ncbi:hypothetical protein [Streptomyces sp. NPDC091371]|uniref:hypothetical protein n=1 Tax=Streptomyces sp. NPDC091371 TaxID=3155303 RepID=UPI00341210FB
MDRRRRRQTSPGVSRYERAQVASLVLQNAIRDARILCATPDGAPTATTSAAARSDDHTHDQAAPQPSTTRTGTPP